jgi:hypothetical protein
VFLFRFGGDLLSRVLRRSTIGATALNGRVRDGIGCFARAMTTKPKKKHQHQPRVGGCSVVQLLLISPGTAGFWSCCYWIRSSLSGN